MAAHDIFYSCNDNEEMTIARRSSATPGYGTITTNFTATPEPFAVTLQANEATDYKVDDWLVFTNGTDSIRVVVMIAGATTITVKPIDSESNTAGWQKTWTGTTVVKPDFVAGTWVTIDLSRAPAGTHRYLIMAAAEVRGSVASQGAFVGVLGPCLRGDPWSTSVTVRTYGLCEFFFRGADSPEHYNALFPVDLEGGQTYQMFLVAIPNTTTTANEVVKISHAKLVAVRIVDGNYVLTGDGYSSTYGTTGSGAEVAATITPGFTGSLLVAYCGVMHANGGTTPGASVWLELYVGGVASGFVYSKSSAQFFSGGAHSQSAGGIGVFASDPTFEYKLLVKRIDGATAAGVKNFCVFVGLLPPGFDSHINSYQQGKVDGTATSAGYTTVDENGQALDEGRYLEFITYGLSHDGNSSPIVQSRPVLSSDPSTEYTSSNTPRGGDGMLYGGASTEELRRMGFYIGRVNETQKQWGSSLKNQIQVKSSGANKGIGIWDPHFIWMKEHDPSLDVADYDQKTVSIDMEEGIVVKAWGAGPYANTYAKDFPDLDLISRVIMRDASSGSNVITELTAVASSTDLQTSNNRFAWDQTIKRLYILVTNDPALNSQTIIVVGRRCYSRDAVALYDDTRYKGASGYVPYEPRVRRIPKVTQSLSVTAESSQVANSYGNLELVSVDRWFEQIASKRIYDGYGLRIRRGWAGVSPNLNDFTEHMNALMGVPELTPESMSIRLYDKRIMLDKPVCVQRMSVYQGTVQVTDQIVPEIFGTCLRVPAYRTTNNVANSGSNTYKIAGHVLKDIAHVSTTYSVFTDTETSKPITAGTVTADLANGQMTVLQVAWGDPGYSTPPDVLYCDVQGRVDGSGNLIENPGAIAKALLKTYGGLTDSDLVLESFRQLDRSWRRTIDVNTGAYQERPLKIGLASFADETVSGQLDVLARACFFFWRMNPLNRVELGIPDQDKANLTRNGGFEYSATSWWPWRAFGGASLSSLSTAIKYEGARCGQVSSSAAAGCIRQTVDFPRSGTFVVSALISLLTGAAQKVKLGIVHPGDGLIVSISDPMTIQSDRWTRVAFPVTIPQGAAGMGFLCIYPNGVDTEATSINIDNVELLHVAGVLGDLNAEYVSSSVGTEIAYECRATYNLNPNLPDRASRMILNDLESVGILSVGSQMKGAAPGSMSANLGLTNFTGNASAAGACGAVVKYMGRPRIGLSAMWKGLMTPPEVGQFLFVDDLHWLDTAQDQSGFMLITGVESDADATEYSIVCERPVDHISDKSEISPQDIPLGAIVFSANSSLTDYTEVTSASGNFIAGAASLDLTPAGVMTHVHDLSHTHTFGAHTHSFTIDTVSAPVGAQFNLDPAGTGNSPSVGPVPPGTRITNAARGQSDPGGGHTHTGTTSAVSGSTSGSSSTPVSAQTSRPGSNLRSYRYVKLFKRTGGAPGTAIPAGTILLWEGATPPAGWAMMDGSSGNLNLGGFLIRACGTKAALSTTSTGSFVASDSGSVLNLTAGANSYKNQRIKLVDGAKVCHVYVVSGEGTNALTVKPLWESGDSIAGTSFASGTTVTGPANTPAAYENDIQNHNHGTDPASTHTHTAPHTHAVSGYGAPVAAGACNAWISADGSYYPYDLSTSIVGHSHPFADPISAGTEVSSAAGATISAALAGPPYIDLMPITPSGTQRLIPAGAIILWDGSACPTGWTRFVDADGKILRGSLTGKGVSSGGHVHSVAYAAHTLTDAHSIGGGTSQSGHAVGGETTRGRDPMHYSYGGGAFPSLGASWGTNPTTGLPYAYGHTHTARYSSIQSQTLTLASIAAASTPALAVSEYIPPHVKFLFCRKN